MRTFTEYLRYQEYDCKHIRIHLKTVVTFENRTINEDSVGSSFNSFTEKSNEMAWADPGGKIIIYMPGAPLMVPYQEFSTSSTGPAHRYQIHMLTGSYLLFRNQLMGNEGSYW